MIEDCTALILAGGESRRMGQDKANLRLGEHTMLQNAVAILQPLFAETILCVRQPRPEIALLQVCDDPLYCGPLAALVSGLERAATPWVYATACDVPFISPEVVDFLATLRAGFQAVVPLVHGYPQPLAAFYAASCLGEAQDCLNSTGKHSMRALLDKLQVRYVGEAALRAVDPVLRSFIDLDTPQDFAAAMNEVRG
jgi:molybdenum cofactor guanylyltransferase